MEKELHYCENCKKETWFTRDEVRQRGSICPNGCQRNRLVFLGDTPEMIEKRKLEFIEKEGYTFEVNPKMDEYQDPYEDRQPTRRVVEEEEFD